MSQKTRVLFVCLGNICRSPTAEGVFQHLVKAAGASAEFQIDSAGTGGWHAGERADRRMRAAAKRRGIALESRARKVDPEDFRRFDYVLAMDQQNLADLRAVAPADGTARVELFRAWDPEGPGEVPDPYYGGDEGFEVVLDMVERTSAALLAELREAHRA